ncbi:TIR domain-containing protein [Lentzea aerocolonigenes]|uniref:TIR domain-containing protein n=1 Tax=Lentzea aerocolonigenes TaxID=68170 RepID=UPI0004C35158|nr:TIR domain-containing protein [Lentzea aerocolonigenes]MCP2243676.1 CHAT domain-containing protein [Lentzea aerocolonigenes]
MEIEPGTPLAEAVKAARSAALRGNVLGVDLAYEKAAKISPIVAHDHCATLLNLGAVAKAAQRCDEYLAESNDTSLRVLRAQIRSAATDHARAAQDVRELRKLKLTELEQAKLARVAALAAADRYDYPTAESELDAAERHFRRAGRTEHLETVGRDRLLLDVRRGTHVPKIDDRTPHTPAEFLQRAAALRRELRYEEALVLMTRCVTSFQIESALRFAVVYELTVLLVLTRQAGAARKLFPLLVAAAGPEVISKLPDATRTLSVERHLDHVRRLIADDELIAAEGMLGQGNSALWHLTSAELAHARGRLDDALHHFHEAVNRSAHAELKALALRKLGDACADAGDEDGAARYWTESHHLEEDVADHQESPSVKLRMLRAAPDEHDGRVLAAVRRVRRSGPKALAGLVVAVEAARGATILTEPRALPRFTDLRAARRWLRRTTRHLPRDQVVWMMHATPDQLHHVIIGRRTVHLTTDVHISDLTDTIRRLKAWKPHYNPAILGALLTELAGLIALDDVIGALPPKITRIAVVAGDVLADVPLVGLPVPGTTHHLGLTHALSSLPCLSALSPLHRRSRGQRGDRTAIFSPDSLLRRATTPGERFASAAELETVLGEHRFQRIRIDAHGTHDRVDPDQSWLTFGDERVSAEALAKLDFSACGTVVLGACESGMAQQRGRDEQVGFVRSAITAGAAAVVAARWKAEDEAARKVLDAFDRNLARLPRDRALQHALREVSDQHPADWACWSLYGDAGIQTTAGPLRRRLRKDGDPVPLETRPKVFLSFAGKDRPHAEQLRTELEARNVNAYLDESAIAPGRNVVAAIDEALATSDYYVLLWSANTPQREWVTNEWTAAFNLEMTRRRAFLFIVRLDEEPLPPLLAPRKHIDMVDAADRLVATWRADRKSEFPVFPQPVPPTPDGPTAAISVRSHDLGVTHVVMTPLHLTGAALYRAVFEAMQLPTEQATFDGTIGMRFSYELYQHNDPIPDDQSVVELTSDLVDIAVRVESFGPRGPFNTKEFRADDELDEGLDVDQQRMLLVDAFRHLLP